MIKTFSLQWKSSKNVAKQRKYALNAPLHLKRHLVNSLLSKELRAAYNRKSFGVRKGDTVKIMRGEFKGTTGKINAVDSKQSLIFVDGAERIRKDGTKAFFPLRSSNLMLIELVTEDKKRAAKLTKKSKVTK
jgi:large subunit ribosomal protein L24